MIHWRKIQENVYFCPKCFSNKKIKLLDATTDDEVDMILKYQTGIFQYACFNCGYIEDSSKFLKEDEAKNAKRTKLIDDML